MTTLRDTIVIFRRQMRLSLRNPWWLVIGVVQPILYLTLLGPLVKHFISQAGPDSAGAWKIFVPGLLVQLGLFGSMFVGFAVIADYRAGVIERMRVTPVSRIALLFGRVLRDVVVLVVQSTILLLTGVAMGLRAPLPGVLCSLGFIITLAISMSSLSYALGLALKNEDALAPLLNSVALPLLLLSGIMLPLTRQSAPAWLYDVSRVNPFWYIVQAMRACFRADYSNGEVLPGVLISVTLAVVCTVLGWRAFNAGAAKGGRRTQDPVVSGLEIAPDPHRCPPSVDAPAAPGSAGASHPVPAVREHARLPVAAPPATGRRRPAIPRITSAVIAEGSYQLVRAPDHAETRAWHVLVDGRRTGLVRPTWRGERSRPGWEPVDLSGLALPVKGTGRITPAGNARTRDAAAVSLLCALQRQQGQERKKAAR